MSYKNIGLLLLALLICQPGEVFSDNQKQVKINENIKTLQRLQELLPPHNRSVDDLNASHGPLQYRLTSLEGIAFKSLNSPLILRLNSEDGLDRIIGGIPVGLNELPWQVALLNPKTGTLFCGGSHIGNGWIVTAAHCISDRYGSTLLKDDILVLIGTNSLTEGGSRVKLLSDPLTHPKWNPSSGNGDQHQNDIALLHIDVQGTLSSIALPLDAVEAPLITDNSNLVVSGWGHTTENGTISTTLLRVGVPIVANDSCTKSYDNSITPFQICAGKTGLDSCQGDSGGPLHGASTEGRILIGVVSYGKGCGREGYPGVYTRVVKYKAWIQETIGS